MYGRGFYGPMMYGINPNIGLTGGITRGVGGARGLGKITGLLKGANWGNLLGNASRALGVINQAVPLVKQAGPMFNNMKSMLKVASAFKDETDTKTTSINNEKLKKEEKKNNISNNSYTYPTTNYQYDNTPNFFL